MCEGWFYVAKIKKTSKWLPPHTQYEYEKFLRIFSLNMTNSSRTLSINMTNFSAYSVLIWQILVHTQYTLECWIEWWKSVSYWACKGICNIYTKYAGNVSYTYWECRGIRHIHTEYAQEVDLWIFVTSIHFCTEYAGEFIIFILSMWRNLSYVFNLSLQRNLLYLWDFI